MKSRRTTWAAGIAAALVLLLAAPVSRAEIFRWEDDAGTTHFTDDASNIPPDFRDRASTVVRESPPEAEPEPPAAGRPPGRIDDGASPSLSNDGETTPPPADGENPSSLAEQLKAKIAAKEALIRTVEERQNLVLNPMRARVLNPGDLELYEKYKAELPRDREELRELEGRIESP